MTKRVKEKLENIFKYPFFENVSVRPSGPVTVVDNWPAAARSCGMNKWQTCQFMARNALQQFVAQRAWTRTEVWNPLIEEVRPPILSFVDNLICQYSLPEKLLRKVRHSVSWDIMLICFEVEFSDVVEPMFYVPLLEPWYAEGHFPCGWDGDEFPNGWDGVIPVGQLIVF